ncbi:MAG: hypothetical protein ACOYD4_14415 [Solirubrobacterales bacterium]
MNRHTFVIQVYPGGISTLENLGTGERVEVAALTAVPPQVETWLEALADNQAISARPYGRDAAPAEPREGTRETDA